MPSVVTITVSPCIDISTSVPELIPDKKLHCGIARKEPGGGGINVSRVLHRLGCDTTAVYMAGGYTGEYFTKMMEKEKVPVKVIKTTSHTRENFVVAETLKNIQYRFGMPGPLIKEEEWMQCLETVSAVDHAAYIVASGSITEGVPVDFFARIAVIAKQKKIKFILDTAGEPLRFALEEGLFMIKPNLGELASIAGKKHLDKAGAVAAAKEIIHEGNSEIVLVSMGSLGALLVTANGAEHVMAPEVLLKSTVGAGDSMLAGMVMALAQNWPYKDALQYAVACGTAATMNKGTALCDPTDVRFLFERIKNSRN